jgi:hypothetical protein
MPASQAANNSVCSSVVPSKDVALNCSQTPERNRALAKTTQSEQAHHDVTLIFKESALFTAKRRARIADEIDGFYLYLNQVGFAVPKEVSPLGTAPGKAMQMVFAEPGTIYDGQIRIPEGSIDDPDAIRSVYGLWFFRQLFRADISEPAAAFTEPAATLFSCYYRSSFSGINVCTSDWSGAKLFNAVWDIHARHGKPFTDRAMLYTYKAWTKPTKSTRFNEFFPYAFVKGVRVIENGEERIESVEKIFHAHVLM